MKLLDLRYLGYRSFRRNVPVGVFFRRVGFQQARQKECGWRNTFGHVNATATRAHYGNYRYNSPNFPI